MAKTHIIYLSGFGDGYDMFRRLALMGWQLFGVSARLVPMLWSTDENYEHKIAQIDTAIKSVDQDSQIVIIGESAGGSMLIPVLKNHPNVTAISLCGKNHAAKKVAARYYQKHSALQPAMEAADKALSVVRKSTRQRLIVAYPLYDEVIPLEESFIPDCRFVRLPSVGHLLTIFLALTLFSPFIIHMIKKS